MQRKTGTEVELDKAVSLFDSIGASSAIDRSASNYLNAAEKEQKICYRQVHMMLTLLSISQEHLILFIKECLFIKEDTKEQPAYVLYRDMENLDFK